MENGIDMEAMQNFSAGPGGQGTPSDGGDTHGVCDETYADDGRYSDGNGEDAWGHHSDNESQGESFDD